jgi:hypothetical protein
MDNPYQSPVVASPSEQSQKTGVRLLPVLRDLAIIWVLTMIGGFYQ